MRRIPASGSPRATQASHIAVDRPEIGIAERCQIEPGHRRASAAPGRPRATGPHSVQPGATAGSPGRWCPRAPGSRTPEPVSHSLSGTAPPLPCSPPLTIVAAAEPDEELAPGELGASAAGLDPAARSSVVARSSLRFMGGLRVSFRGCFGLADPRGPVAESLGQATAAVSSKFVLGQS